MSLKTIYVSSIQANEHVLIFSGTKAQADELALDFSVEDAFKPSLQLGVPADEIVRVVPLGEIDPTDTPYLKKALKRAGYIVGGLVIVGVKDAAERDFYYGLEVSLPKPA